jgi:hypothetical protein
MIELACVTLAVRDVVGLEERDSEGVRGSKALAVLLDILWEADGIEEKT